jgi:adenosylcobinamide amidohydrolase
VIEVTLSRPWLRARLPAPMRVLSWAPHGGGWRTTGLVLWREVRNADLVPGFDAEGWLAGEMPDPGAVGMLTSRDIGSWDRAQASVEGASADCVATLGLSNAEAVGRRLPWHGADYGTINLLVATDVALTETAQLEAMSIAVQARTAALMDADLHLASGRATGTGTDCVALACPPGDQRYAGLHTAVGEAIGAAVREVIGRAATDWRRWRDGARGERAGQAGPAPQP